MVRGEDPDEDTVIGVSPPALVEPIRDARSEGDYSVAEADTIIRESRPANPKLRSAADAPGSESVSRPIHAAHPDRAAHPMSFIRIGSHEPIPLDVPAYIGRRPSSPRITGGRLPRLVMVPSPSREVSATHLEIRQEGRTVVVTDLGSTNGTLVTHPRGAPTKLRQGESVVVVGGSIVDIGDGIRVVIVPGTGNQSAEGSQ